MNQIFRHSLPVCVFAMISLLTNQALGLSESSLMDPIAAKEIYAEVRPMYEAYERNHGGWIETRNGPMHYLHWNKAEKGMTLLWVHGTYDSAYSLMPVIAELNKMEIEIDAVSENDPYPTTDQNRRLQQLHPDLIEHQYRGRSRRI